MTDSPAVGSTATISRDSVHDPTESDRFGGTTERRGRDVWLRTRSATLRDLPDPPNVLLNAGRSRHSCWRHRGARTAGQGSFGL